MALVINKYNTNILDLEKKTIIDSKLNSLSVKKFQDSKIFLFSSGVFCCVKTMEPKIQNFV